MIFKGLKIEVQTYYAYVEADDQNEAKKILEALQNESPEIWHIKKPIMENIVGIEQVVNKKPETYVNKKSDIKSNSWICCNCKKRMKGGYIQADSHYCSSTCYKIIEGKYPV
tara:strand:+ start:3180 stop:3515 length:336 start_codon:yes stop_codon:yes gene_type:complete